ncbi:RNA 3'-terminal phosphate cyclase [Candidatus Woesearchaeota archaeon]|nr:RNA 3'-terminal phosphate cyclase [Candidatus Woesearchaeota archaeon]MBW3005192.1 RNA 3'-terminal phosphate cyclase [Candidatus Woesearchaeota archaeon]
MIHIDGDYKEGGGQIVRTALALSTITQIPFTVDHIRQGRKDAGLKPQHLFCIKGLEQLCEAKAEGAEFGSSKLKYNPGKIKGKTIKIDIGTAGSISLLMQSLLLPCFFADKQVKLKLTGGTNTKWSMPIEYFQEIFVPYIRKFCQNITVKLIKRGYFPKGGGEVEIKIKPKFKLSDYPDFKAFLEEIRKQNLGIDSTEQHNLIQIKGVSHASKHLEKAEVADRQAKAAKFILSKYEVPVNIRTEYCDALSPGSGITLWAIFSKQKEDLDLINPIILGADTLGERGKPSEKVGEEAAKDLIKQIESKAPIDAHMADNLIPWMALFCPSKIKVSEITDHTRTNIYVVDQFLGKIFEIAEENKIISAKLS